MIANGGKETSERAQNSTEYHHASVDSSLAAGMQSESLAKHPIVKKTMFFRGSHLFYMLTTSKVHT
jgi:hypothetical protein